MARRTLALTLLLAAGAACAVAWVLLREAAPLPAAAAAPAPAAREPTVRASGAALEAAPAGSSGKERVELGAAPAADAAPGMARAPEAPEAEAPRADIAGRVVDDLGAPIAAFQVTARQRGAVPAQAGSADVVLQGEGAGGAFLLADVPRGRWRVHAAAADHVLVEKATEIDAPLQAPLTIVLHRAASLAGTVVDPAGLPVAGARVVAGFPTVNIFENMRPDQATASGEDGRFELRPLAPGRHTVLAEKKGWARSEPLEVDLEPGARDASLVLALRAGGRLTGEVLRGGRPAGDRAVSAFAEGRGYPGKTDDQGRFALDHVAAGAYQVLVLEDEAPLLSTSAEVRDGDTTHLVLELDEGGVRVRGRVTRGGKPLDDLDLTAVAEGEPLLSSMSRAESEPDGRYEIQLKGPGRYVFLFDDEEVHVAIPDVPEHVLDIELPSGRIAGRVAGPEGALASARVTLSREDGGTLLAYIDGPASATTDADGRYAFEGLAAGVYTATAHGARPLGLGARARNGLALAAGGALEGVDFELLPGGVLRGIVRAADGRPAPDAALYVRDARGVPLTVFPVEMTNPQGRYTLEALPAGALTVEARTRDEAAPPAAVRVVAGLTQELAIELRPAGFVRVLLSDRDGAPLAGTVSVRDEQGHEQAGLQSRADAARLIQEGVSACARLVGPLPPGPYRVAARDGDGREAAREVRVEAGGELAVDLVLQ